MSKRILLVEDEALIAMTEAAMLKKDGYEVITAYKAQNAVEAARKEDIDLVLMDIDLGRGRMDGTEAAEIILEEKDLPIVFLSSHTEPEVVQKTEGITSYGYIVKNSGETVLLASIRMAFRLYDAHVELKRQKEHLNTALVKYEQTAEELAEKSGELERYFTSSLDMLCIANTEGELIRLNPEWEKVLGYTVSELEGRSFFDFVHEDDGEATLEAAAKLDAQEDVTSFENRFRCKDGSYRWIEWRSTPMGTKIYAVARDITERKQAEDEIRAREENLRTILKSIGDAVISTDVEGRVTWMNPVAERLCGWQEEDAQGKKLEEVFKIVNSYTREDADNPVKRVMRSGKIVGLVNHTVLISKEGQEYQIADSAAPIKDDNGKINGVVLVFRDVTEDYLLRRRTEESERMLSNVFDAVQAGISVLDNDLSILLVNGWIEEKHGESNSFVGKKCYEVYQKRQTPCPGCPSLLSVSDGTPHTRELEVPTQGEGTYWSEITAYPMKDEHGTVAGVVEYVSDITRRKQTESKIIQDRHRLKAILDGTNVGTWEWNAQTGETHFNERWASIIGYTLEEISPVSIETWKRFAHPEDYERSEQALRAHFAGETEFYEVQARMRHKNGNWVWVLDRGKVATWTDDGKPLMVMGTHQDITENKQAEANLKKALWEKDFLMKELNHRIKNNLNLVSSLIRLKGEETAEDLSDLVFRIEAISLVHEKLHQHEDIERIEVKEYFQELLLSIFSLTADRNVQIVNTTDDMSIPTKTAIPLGLIVNEIATNAIKYGFTSDGEALFSVSLRKDEDSNRYILTLSNTGLPFPEDIDVDASKTLGLQLISALVGQLEGTLELKKIPHPVFTVTFPIEE